MEPSSCSRLVEWNGLRYTGFEELLKKICAFHTRLGAFLVKILNAARILHRITAFFHHIGDLIASSAVLLVNFVLLFVKFVLLFVNFAFLFVNLETLLVSLGFCRIYPFHLSDSGFC